MNSRSAPPPLPPPPPHLPHQVLCYCFTLQTRWLVGLSNFSLHETKLTTRPLSGVVCNARGAIILPPQTDHRSQTAAEVFFFRSTYWTVQQNSSPRSATKAQHEGRFPAAAAANSRCAGAGSGERRDETKKKGTFNLLIHPRPPLSTTTRSAPPPTTEPAAAAFARPPIGRRFLRHDRNTHKFTRESADRRPPAALIAALSRVSSVVR